MVRRLEIGESQAQIASWLEREFPSESPQTRYAAYNRGVQAQANASTIAGNNPNELLGAKFAVGQAPGITGYRYTLRVFFEGTPGSAGTERYFTYYSPIPLTYGQLEAQVSSIANVVFQPQTAPEARYSVGQGMTFSGISVDAVLRANS